MGDHWKKQATQVVAAKEDQEKTFADMAYRHVANKASALIDGQHLLGFEVVWGNDKSTRMVGIFAFRVNERLLYAPVFFLEGDIRGAEFLYMTDKKLFTLLSDEWATYLAETYNNDEGRGVRQDNQFSNRLNMSLVINPPQTGGMYNFGGGGLRKGASFTDQSLALDVETDLSERLLPRFLADAPDNECAGLLDKMASLLDDYNLAEAAAHTYDWDKDILQPLEGRFAKLAAEEVAPPEPELYVLRDPADIIKEAGDLLDDAKRDGFIIVDKRKIADKNIIVMARDLDMASPDQPGVYSTLSADGTPVSVFVAPVLASDSPFALDYEGTVWPTDSNHGKTITGDTLGNHLASRSRGSRNAQRWGVVDFHDGRWARTNDMLVLHNTEEDVSAFTLPESLTEKPKQGTMSVLVYTDPVFVSCPFYVLDVTEKSGITIISYQTKHGDIGTLKLNPSLSVVATVLPEGGVVYGGGAKFLELTGAAKNCTTEISKDLKDSGWIEREVVKSTKGNSSVSRLTSAMRSRGIGTFEVPALSLMGGDSVHGLTEFISQQGLHIFGMALNLSAHTSRDRIVIRPVPSNDFVEIIRGKSASTRVSAKYTDYASEYQAQVWLARDMGIDAADVRDVMARTKAAAGGEIYWVVCTDTPEKQANVLRIMDEPDWDEEVDDVHGIRVREDGQQFALRTDRTVLPPPRSRLGDHVDMRRQASNSTNEGDPLIELRRFASPEVLQQYAQSHSLPNVFDHGAVASLLKTYDSAAVLDIYVPDLEKGLDRIARILFLFYWKPEDFEKAFGLDDMQNLENQLISNFRSLGDLVLDLKKKVQYQQEGTGALSNS